MSSRLLRSLEAAGLVVVGPKESDKRVRIARLTRHPASDERAVLDRRSDALAVSLLEPLSRSQRLRMVAAMADVERLLSAAMVQVVAVDPADPRARYCLNAYFAALDRRFDNGFDPARSISADEDELRPPSGVLCLYFLGRTRSAVARSSSTGRTPPS